MTSSLNAYLGSDTFLSVVFLAFIAFASLRLIPARLRVLLSGTSNTVPLEKAIYSFAQYERSSMSSAARMKNAYLKGTRSNSSQRRIGASIGYLDKLNRLEYAIHVNSVITKGISRVASEDFGVLQTTFVDQEDSSRVREALKHFVRDWSAEGRLERDAVFAPIYRILSTLEPDRAQRENKHVLIPGSGLGRLAWEISELGFDTTANECSPYMNLAFHFLLSRETRISNQHSLHPYAQWFSHQRTDESLFRAIKFPDSVPRLSPTFHLNEVDFFDVKVPKSSDGYSYIVTLFFIDVSLNIIKTIQQIFSLLKPGGVWINLGPLLWPSLGAALELSLEQVLQVVTEVGFELLPLSQFGDTDNCTSRTIECEYTADQNAMMRWIYKAELWVARKPLI